MYISLHRMLSKYVFSIAINHVATWSVRADACSHDHQRGAEAGQRRFLHRSQNARFHHRTALSWRPQSTCSRILDRSLTTANTAALSHASTRAIHGGNGKSKDGALRLANGTSRPIDPTVQGREQITRVSRAKVRSTVGHSTKAEESARVRREM